MAVWAYRMAYAAGPHFRIQSMGRVTTSADDESGGLYRTYHQRSINRSANLSIKTVIREAQPCAFHVGFFLRSDIIVI